MGVIAIVLSLRILTASVLILGVILGLFYLPQDIFNVIVALFMLVGAWETAQMFWPGNLSGNLKKQTIFLALVLLAAIISFHYFTVLGIVIGSIWWLFVPTFLVRYVKKPEEFNFSVSAKNSMGILIFVPFFLALSLLQMQFGPRYVLFILSLVWANDIGAYFAGTFFGKTLLAPSISPKKTWEGLIGGLVLGLIVIICGGFLLNIHGIRWVLWVTLNIVISLWSVIGDLFESMLKRLAKVKDSGNLLPGHGGIYDRIDSLTAAIPLFVLAIIVCGF